MVVGKPSRFECRKRTGPGHLARLCLLGRLPHQVRQGEDFVQSAYAILKVPPERYAQFPASFLQADKGVAAAPA